MICDDCKMYCDSCADICDICGLCEYCCTENSECMMGMCAEDPDYADHFCVDCGQCFCLNDSCPMCYVYGENRCATCCNRAVSEVLCYCGRCISEPDFAEHVRTVHGDSYESHTPIPDTVWTYDDVLHWKECRLCGEESHRTQNNSHSYDDGTVCTICGVQKPKGDIDGDGVITITDASLAYNHLKYNDELSDAEFYVADIVSDGQINILDIMAILNRI